MAAESLLRQGATRTMQAAHAPRTRVGWTAAPANPQRAAPPHRSPANRRQPCAAPRCGPPATPTHGISARRGSRRPRARREPRRDRAGSIDRQKTAIPGRLPRSCARAPHPEAQHGDPDLRDPPRLPMRERLRGFRMPPARVTPCCFPGIPTPVRRLRQALLARGAGPQRRRVGQVRSRLARGFCGRCARLRRACAR
jgi:hypothetical protein